VGWSDRVPTGRKITQVVISIAVQYRDGGSIDTAEGYQFITDIELGLYAYITTGGWSKQYVSAFGKNIRSSQGSG
jgi:hypothetical protein